MVGTMDEVRLSWKLIKGGGPGCDVVGLADGTVSKGFCDWIRYQNLRCWVGMGFYQTSLSVSCDSDKLTCPSTGLTRRRAKLTAGSAVG